MGDLPDVDVEVLNRDEAISLFPEAVVASQEAGGKLVRHVGIYFQDVPVNPLNGLASLPYKHAEEQGFHKIDILSCPYPYEGIESMDELRALLDSPIDWNWFLDEKFVSSLFQLNGYADVVSAYAPQSIEDLAALVAIIRPQKQHLIGKSWDVVRDKIWEREEDGRAFFKKSHAIAYALVLGIDARRKAKSYFSEQQSQSSSSVSGEDSDQQD